MPHDQLRFDLVDRVHCYANHDQQRSSAEIKIYVQPVQHPIGQMLEKASDRPSQVIEVNADHHPFRNERNDDEDKNRWVIAIESYLGNTVSRYLLQPADHGHHYFD